MQYERLKGYRCTKNNGKSLYLYETIYIFISQLVTVVIRLLYHHFIENMPIKVKFHLQKCYRFRHFQCKASFTYILIRFYM